jgi:hypothetical protein
LTAEATTRPFHAVACEECPAGADTPAAEIRAMSSIVSFSYQPLMRGQTAPTAPALSSA